MRDGPGELRQRFHADQSGMALIYITLMLPVIVGFALLAIDASRVYILSAQLQHGADAIALAMAAELDRTSDSLTRAVRAKDNIVSNPALFTSSYSAVSGSAVTYSFLKALPASDATLIDPSDTTYVTTTPSEAHYVQVKVNAASFSTLFPAAFINAVGNFTTSATAVAGMDTGACNVVPMFICNPLEPSGNKDPSDVTELLAHVASTASKRKVFELKEAPVSGQTATYSPGNFGYVQTPLGKGGHSLSQAIALAVPGACIGLRGIQTLNSKTGNMTDIDNAINVRFDIYNGSYKNNSGDNAYRPAVNNRKSYVRGKTGNNKDCNPTEVDIYDSSKNYSVSNVPAAMGFPRDSNIKTPDTSTGRLGNGDWNGMYELYMTTNFPNSADRPSLGSDSSGTAYSKDNLPTRYDVYKAEIANAAGLGSKSMAAAACYSGTPAPNMLPDRRLIFVAIANCIATPLSGGTTKIDAVAFGQFFLTEPVGASKTVYGELVNVLRPGTGNGTNGAIIADNVQLYR